MGHVAHLRGGERRGVYRVMMGKSEGRDHLEDPGLDGRTILSWIFRKSEGGGGWSGLIWLRRGTGGEHL